MDTIRTYLDNMFMGLDQSNKVTKAKEELLTMMEDKYNELKNEGKSENEAIGIVISEFGNLEEVSETLGIQQETQTKEEILKVSLIDAKDYIDTLKNAFPKLGFGIMLCVISVIPIFVMLILYNFNILGLNEDQSAIIGVTGLLLLVAIGVLIIIKNGHEIGKFDHYEKENFILDYDARSYVENEKEQASKKFRNGLSIAVGMYIISVIPVVVLGGLFPFDEGIQLIGLVAMFILIGLATWLLVSKIGGNLSTKVLLQEDEYRPAAKAKRNKMDKIASVYWLVIVAAYFIWSFMSSDWRFTWVIFPIAGVIYAIIETIVED